MAKANKDMKPQTHGVYSFLTLFQFFWNESGAHPVFHSDHSWQKMQAASSRYLCDNPPYGEAGFAWRWAARDRGICVKQGGKKYPDVSGRYL